MKTVDVIIPVYKPTGKLKKIISMLERQSYPVDHIILINTEEKYFNNFFYGDKFLEKYHNLIIRHISSYEFDHGGTRRMAVTLSEADYFICMTDDAVPQDEKMVECLLTPLLEEKAWVSYGRQLPGKHSSEMEHFTRKFNYPKESAIKTKADIETMGIKAFFCSNVCAAYDRAKYDELGGFIKRTIFNEDMIYAYQVLQADGAIAYAADAKVIHSHHYTNLQQLKRNFDLGVSQADHPEIFGSVSSASEGKRLVFETTAYLKKIGKRRKIPGLYLTSFYKYLGYRLGKAYHYLPKALIMKLTMNRYYWKKY
ncbi:MAG: glycosyltransferase [Lachnospiraceae bacterium]|nr:glycosyltransferase [Lachnospiraceae bacterium]